MWTHSQSTVNSKPKKAGVNIQSGPNPPVEKRKISITRDAEIAVSALPILAVANPSLVRALFENCVRVRGDRFQPPREWLNSNCQGRYHVHAPDDDIAPQWRAWTIGFEHADDLALFKLKYEGTEA